MRMNPMHKDSGVWADKPLAAQAPDRFFFRDFDFQVEFTRTPTAG